MAVRVNGVIDFSKCPECVVEFQHLVSILDSSLGTNGILISSVNLPDVFASMGISYVAGSGYYEYGLFLKCKGACRIELPQTVWVISDWTC
jgi:hypothetical protein